MAILEKPSGPELLLQKQFRPPVDKAVIEIPAGLVDAGESAAESAVRELREETGYVGEVSEVSPIMFNGMHKSKRGRRLSNALTEVSRPRLLQYEPQYGPRHGRHELAAEPGAQAGIRRQRVHRGVFSAVEGSVRGVQEIGEGRLCDRCQGRDIGRRN